MRVDLFDFELPQDRIALRPARPRDSARLLLVEGSETSDRQVLELPDLLCSGDVLVFNDTKVIPAQLEGRRGEASIGATLHKREGPREWQAFLRNSKRARVGDRIDFGECVHASVVDKAEDGSALLHFHGEEPVELLLERAGRMPLPPYIASKRPADAEDRADYQTMFAREEGAVAAPTAALHFTPELLNALDERGIGRETAQLLAAAGARVMVVSRSADELATLGLEYVVADLGTPEGCALAVAETARRLGPIDILVVNHGIGSAHERLVWEQDPEVWRETMRINLDGPFELARLTVGGMCKRGFGRLVFTSSTAGEKAERSGSAYTASKHGVIGLARAVAQDAGPFGVTSNAVLPGWVRTAMAERSAKAESERRGISVEQVWSERAAIYPQNRVLDPREVAQVIAFLCSDAAGAVNGEAITVALGGMW